MNVSAVVVHIPVLNVFMPGPLFIASGTQDSPQERRSLEWLLVLWAPSQEKDMLKNDMLFSLAPSPVSLAAMLPLWRVYPSRKAVRYLEERFREGFHIPAEGTLITTSPPNQKSVREMLHITQKKIEKECDLGRVTDLFPHPPFNKFIVSLLRIIPQKVLGEFHMIHNLSYPKGGSVNNIISQEKC